jgi:ABC-type Fe3+/spermidine/putrescine transport system ATPase subunit
MSHIRLESIVKSFGPTRVLDGCSVVVEKGSVTTLLGPSGCGKTTLLRTLAGFVEPDAGRVLVGGRDITDLPPNRRQVGYVFQSYALFPHLDVAANVAYGLRVRRVGRSETETRVKRALDLVSLSGLADRYPARLSGGQQQRVAIARALALKPDILLLDEVTAALDPELVGEVLDTIRALQRDGMTMLIVSHEMAFIREVASRVVFLDQGSIIETGPPAEVFDHPRSPRLKEFTSRILRH